MRGLRGKSNTVIMITPHLRQCHKEIARIGEIFPWFGPMDDRCVTSADLAAAGCHEPCFRAQERGFLGCCPPLRGLLTTSASAGPTDGCDGISRWNGFFHPHSGLTDAITKPRVCGYFYRTSLPCRALGCIFFPLVCDCRQATAAA